jgi:hypothetical protein
VLGCHEEVNVSLTCFELLPAIRRAMLALID